MMRRNADKKDGERRIARSFQWVSAFFVFSFFFLGKAIASTPWIFAPQADSLARICFRKAYITKGRPQQATLTITTTGFCKLYVNECKVGTSPYMPLRSDGNQKAVELTFDTTPYMRPDTNVVAVLYSPVRPADTETQIAVRLFGRDHDHAVFCYESDDSWLCRRANSWITPNGEEIVDGRSHDQQWEAATIYDSALWLQAKKGTASSSCAYSDQAVLPAITHITTWYQDSILQNDITAPNGFYGFYRATIREARRGEEICLGPLRYICNGNMDEQAYPQFGAAYTKGITIKGNVKRLTTLEMIEVNRKENYE